MGIGRKLEDIRQGLTLLGEQGKTKGFFNNVENADKLGGLVEDVRDAVMDYQVCMASSSLSSCAHASCRRRCNGTCTTRVSCSSLVPSNHHFRSSLVADK